MPIRQTPSSSTTSTQHSIPSTDDINALWRSHRRYARSYKENKRKQSFYKLLRLLAYACFAYDIFITYQGVYSFSSSESFALFTALFVGGLQWAVSESLLSRSLGGLTAPDLNGDGRVSVAEFGRLLILWGSIATAYGLDIATNVVAIDAAALGTLPFTIMTASPAVPVWVSWTVTLLVCVVLCFSDEMLHSYADNRLSDLEEELPALKERAAVVTAKLQAAGAFSAAYVGRATEAGRKRGESAPI